MVSLLSLTFTLLFCSVTLATHRQPPGPNAVLLGDVQTLTLHLGQETTGRRSAPQPQLQCVGGKGNRYADTVKIVQCYNKGFDGRDFQWKCESQMDTRARFGRLEVSCEGYRNPEDEWVLAGSCGLEYELDLVPQPSPPPPPPPQQQQQPKKTSRTTTTTTTTSAHRTPVTTDNNAPELIALLFIVCVVGGVFCLCVFSPSSSSPSYRRSEYPTRYQASPPPHTVTSEPVVHNRVPSPVILTQPATVIVQQPQPSSSSGYLNGYVDATLMSNLHHRTAPPQHHHHYQEPQQTRTEVVTTHVVESEPSSSWSNSSSSSSASVSTPTTHVSSGYGGTRKR
jgi:hypothetical protein